MSDYVTITANILANNWVAANTDGITPTIQPIYEFKELALGANRDYILTYFVSRVEKPAEFGYASTSSFDTVSVDIRTMYGGTFDQGRTHAEKVKDEARRILLANRKAAASVIYADSLTVTGMRDLSDRSVRLWRYVLECVYENYAETV